MWACDRSHSHSDSVMVLSSCSTSAFFWEIQNETLGAMYGIVTASVLITSFNRAMMVFVGSGACVHGYVLDKVNKGQWDFSVQVHPKTTMFLAHGLHAKRKSFCQVSFSETVR